MRPPVLLLIHLSLCEAAKIFRKWLSVIIRATHTHPRVCFIFIADTPQFPIFLRCYSTPLALSAGTISCYFTLPSHPLSYPTLFPLPSRHYQRRTTDERLVIIFVYRLCKMSTCMANWALGTVQTQGNGTFRNALEALPSKVLTQSPESPPNPSSLHPRFT